MIWRDLRLDPPTRNDRCVLLFPCITDVGILYTTSNPDYARGPHAITAGYTHWAEIEPHPDEPEVEAKRQQLFEQDK